MSILITVPRVATVRDQLRNALPLRGSKIQAGGKYWAYLEDVV